MLRSSFPTQQPKVLRKTCNTPAIAYVTVHKERFFVFGGNSMTGWAGGSLFREWGKVEINGKSGWSRGILVQCGNTVNLVQRSMALPTRYRGQLEEGCGGHWY